MAGWNGIYYNGLWVCGMDFLANGTPPAGVPFDSAGGTISVNASYARYSGKGVGIGNNSQLGRTYQVNLPTSYAGFAFQTTVMPTGGIITGICTLFDAATGQVKASLGYNVQGAIGIYGAGGVNPGGAQCSSLFSGALSANGVIIPNAYAYVEFLGGISSSSGTLTVKVNGITAATFTGVTNLGTNAYANQIFFGQNFSGGGSHNFDDFYLLDNTGSAPFNTFLGPVRVQTDGPNADSATGGLNAWAFTTPQGTDYGNAANIPPVTADYNYDATVNDRMSFRFPALTGVSRVFALNTWYNAEIDAAGTRTIVPIFRSNAVDQVGPTANNLTGSYVYYYQPSTIDPNTAASWYSGTVAAAQSCEIGLKVAS